MPVRYAARPSVRYVTNRNPFCSSYPRDPKFRDAAAGDYRLLLGSSAIDTGAALTEVAFDRHGIARPQGEKHDLGAHEFIAEQNH